MILHPHEKDELHFLRHFYSYARHAMGPADDDIYQSIKEDWLERGYTLPEGYEIENDDE